MSETHDIALEAGGYDFRVRVYPASEPNGAALVWLHGGAFMFGTLEMPEADQVGRRLSAAGITVISVDYTLAPLDALEWLAPPDSDADFPSPEQLRAEAEAAGPRARFPVAGLQTVAAFDWAVAERRHVRRRPRPRGARRRECGRQPLGRRRHATARPGDAVSPACSLWSIRRCMTASSSRTTSWRDCWRPSRLRASSPRRTVTRSTATTCPTLTATRTATRSRAVTISPGFPRC